jgi:hypothetical protein
MNGDERARSPSSTGVRRASPSGSAGQSRKPLREVKGNFVVVEDLDVNDWVLI